MAGSIIYGPVSSWRLGRSLGVDLLSTKVKTCSFDCIYCQLGRTVHPLAERKEFVSLDKLAEELETVKGMVADHVTFSGLGEPTLASNLGEAIGVVKSVLKLPVAVLTNSSLMTGDDVRRELSQADVIVAKVDAPNEELFCQINRPALARTLGEIINALKLFRHSYQGKLALQMMFVEANKDYAPEMANIAQDIAPDEVQINTPLRPSLVKPLAPEDIGAIQQAFFGISSVVTVYQASRLKVVPLNREETLLRRSEL